MSCNNNNNHRGGSRKNDSRRQDHCEESSSSNQRNNRVSFDARISIDEDDFCRAVRRCNRRDSGRDKNRHNRKDNCWLFSMGSGNSGCRQHRQQHCNCRRHHDC